MDIPTEWSPPQPLPRIRKRALTIPLPSQLPSVAEHEQWTNDQLQSVFFLKLPLEIRQRIYQEALGQHGPDDVIHVALISTRLAHIRCWQEDKRAHGWDHKCWTTSTDTCVHNGRADGNPSDEALLPLLRTCRQVYSEAIRILYSHNTFNFSHSQCVRHFASSILPERLNSVRSLHLDTIYRYSENGHMDNFMSWLPEHPDLWNETWRIIASMRGLRDVRLRLSISGFSFEKGYERDPDVIANLLEPLKAVKVKDFKVELTEALTEELKTRLGNVPFQIEHLKDAPKPEDSDTFLDEFFKHFVR